MKVVRLADAAATWGLTQRAIDYLLASGVLDLYIDEQEVASPPSEVSDIIKDLKRLEAEGKPLPPPIPYPGKKPISGVKVGEEQIFESRKSVAPRPISVELTEKQIAKATGQNEEDDGEEE